MRFHFHRWMWVWDEPPPKEYVIIKCPECGGSGLMDDFVSADLQTCDGCRGTGKRRRVKILAFPGHYQCSVCGEKEKNEGA